MNYLIKIGQPYKVLLCYIYPVNIIFKKPADFAQFEFGIKAIIKDAYPF